MNRAIILTFSLFSMVSILAQKPEQFLHFNIGQGAHNLNYNIQNGTQSGQSGITVNGAYSYFFNKNWGIQTGLGIQTAGALSIYNDSIKTPDIDSDNEPFEFRTIYQNWNEKQQSLFLTIPIAAQYKYSLTKRIGIFGSLGAAMAFPIRSNYKSTAGSIKTTGYYSEYNAELTDFPDEKFGTIFDNFDGKISLKPSVMGVADIGGLFSISKTIQLYVGGYVNYGLNNIEKPDNKSVYQKDGVYNGLFASNQISKVKPVAFGVKIGFSLNLAKADANDVVIDAPIYTPQETVAPKVIHDTVYVYVDVPKVVETVKIVEVPAKVETPKVVEKPVVEPAVTPYQNAANIAKSLVFRFDENSDELNSKIDNTKLKTLVAYLKANPNAQIEIIGHTCDIGTRKNNMKVCLKRAEEIKQRLVKLGAPESQLKTSGKAFDEPLVPNTTEANRKKNRRVELKLGSK